MGGKTLAARERQELCDLMDQLGPDVPTLCAGWMARDLAAHLVLRERRMDAALGALLPLAGYTDRVQRSIAQRPWSELVDSIRVGPPWWSPWSLPIVGDKGNTMEFFVHHEDVRRAQQGWTSRTADDRRDRELWAVLRLAARGLYRNSPAGVVLRTPEGLQCTPRRAERSVTVTGSPEELTLHAYGRDRAVVELDGAEVDVLGLEGSRRGL